MNRYETSTPRVAFALAAVALTGLTLALSVIIPARMDTSTIAAPAAVIVSDAPTRVERIDVIAVREPKIASVRVRANRPI
jgi:hypothetical protein